MNSVRWLSAALQGFAASWRSSPASRRPQRKSDDVVQLRGRLVRSVEDDLRKDDGTEKAVFIRRTDGESLAQIRAEKSNPRADVYHAAESASAKQLAAEGLLGSLQVATGRQPARLGATDRGREQVLPDADLHRRAGLGLQHGAAGQEEAAASPSAGRTWRNPGLQGRDPDGEPGDLRHRDQHRVDGAATHGRRRGLQVPRGDEQERQPIHALGQCRDPCRWQARRRSASRSCTTRSRRPSRVTRSRPVRRAKAPATKSFRPRSSRAVPTPRARGSGWTSCCRPRGRTYAVTVNKFQIPSNKNAQVHPMAPKSADVKLIKLDLDKYGSKEGRERLLDALGKRGIQGAEIAVRCLVRYVRCVIHDVPHAERGRSRNPATCKDTRSPPSRKRRSAVCARMHQSPQ